MKLTLMLLIAATLSLVLGQIMPSLAVAEDQLLQELPRIVSDSPQSTTPTALKPSNVKLTWTNNNDSNTYDVRIASSTEVNDATNELTAPVDMKYTLATNEYVPVLPEATYYWQVRSCNDMAICQDWSGPWRLTVDGTAPIEPTANVTSDAYETTPTLVGTAESGATVTVTIGDATCQTISRPDGSWECTFSVALEYGKYDALITSTDPAGNQSMPYKLQVIIKELFVAPQIIKEELPTVLNIVPANESPENKVYERPLASVLDAAEATNETNKDQSPSVLGATTQGGLIQPSDKGWQMVGIPWFVWLGATAGLIGVWWITGIPGPRRLGSVLFS